MFRYLFKLDKKKHQGADSFERYLWIKAFQKLVDLVYKYTRKNVEFEGVKGMNVLTVNRRPWGEDFSRPEKGPSRYDYEVTLAPDLNPDNLPKSQELFDDQYEKFKEEFSNNSRGMGIDFVQPIPDSKTKDAKVTFSFLTYDLNREFPGKYKSNMNESKTEKGWGDSEEKLEKKFKFKDFNQAIKFVNKVAEIAEKQNHHPDIEVNFNKVKISITDHEKGGVSEKCHKFVDEVNKLTSKKTEELQEKCWPGYQKKGMKTMFGKRYPNCVKIKK